MKKSISLLLLAGVAFAIVSFIVIEKKKFIDPANMDLSVKPGDNFYLYANGTWLKKNPVPASKTRWGSFDLLRQTSLDRLKILCESAAANAAKSSINQRVGDLYASSMDSVVVEKLGFTPIKPMLDRLGKVASPQDVLTEITSLRTHGIGGALFGFRIDQDDKNVNKYIAVVSQGGTSLPDRDYYLKNDPRSQNIRKEYLKYVGDMFKLVGDDEATAAKKAQGIMGLETGLAKVQLSRVALRDPIKTYNKFSVADFTKSTPGIEWKTVLTNLKVKGADTLLTNNPDFFRTADVLLSSVPSETWSAYLQWSVIKATAPFLSSPFVSRQFEFNKVLSGQKVNAPRWQRMSAMVDRSLGELLGQLYVEKYFTAAAKQRMLALVKNMQTTFDDRINKLEWMSDVTKQKAKEKLTAIVNKIGFPDKWETYTGVTISRTDMIGNVMSANVWAYDKMVNRLGTKVDKTEWGMTPPTINAYYNPANNEIAFPAGILQFPFFDFEADDAVNYGGIAAVIGHELTHGFDDQGRQYAADGNLKEWWTKDDAKKFTERADQVVAQYGAFTVNDTIHVNGKLTLGENLADLGGLSIAYEAFKKTEQGKGNKQIDGFTPDQRFFLNWAQVWRSNALPETSAQLVMTDPHSPGMYRCNGPIVNIDAWYAAFNITATDKMFKPADKRTRIW
jgi:putative endopeptidase